MPPGRAGQEPGSRDRAAQSTTAAWPPAQPTLSSDLPKRPRGASCSGGGAEGTFTSPGSGLPLCRAWPGVLRGGHHCCLSTARLTDCLLPLRLGWPIWPVSRGLGPQPFFWRRVLRAGTCVLRPLLTLLGCSSRSRPPAQGASDQAGPWPRPAHHGGLFQGLGLMAKARDMLVPAIRHHESAAGESQHKAMAPFEGPPAPRAPAPGGNSPLGLVSGFWLRNGIYYGNWIRLQDRPGQLPSMALPRHPSTEAQNASGGRRREHPRDKTSGV